MPRTTNKVRFLRKVYKNLSKPQTLNSWVSVPEDNEVGILRRLDFAYGLTIDDDESIREEDVNPKGFLAILKESLRGCNFPDSDALITTLRAECLDIKNMILAFMVAKYDDFNTKSASFLNTYHVNAESTRTIITMLNINERSVRFRNINGDAQQADFLHIPFNKRYLTGTYRYSIPGYPSFYTAKSAYGAWEELNRPKLESCCCVNVKTRKNARLLDLRFQTKDMDDQHIEDYLKIFPLILACSMQVRDNSERFIPEYIIPQQVFKCLMNNLKVDIENHVLNPIIGIVYTSSKNSAWKELTSGRISIEEMTNYAFLAHLDVTSSSILYSKHLAEHFKIGKVHSLKSIEDSACISMYNKLKELDEKLQAENIGNKMTTVINNI